jgi:hypothetical protein
MIYKNRQLIFNLSLWRVTMRKIPIIMAGIYYVLIFTTSLYSQHYKENENTTQTEEQQLEIPIVKEEFNIQSGGFIDSFIWLKLFFGGSFIVWGEIIDKEEDYYNRNKDPLVTNQTNKNYPAEMSNGKSSFGCEIDLMFPAIKYKQKRGFDLTSIKFGVKSTYLYSSMGQAISDDSPSGFDGDGHTYYSGTLLKYQSINIGPEMNMIFSPISNRINMVVQFYLTGGYIFNGEINAAPGLRHFGLNLSESDYHAKFTGYTGTIGAGVHSVFNMAFPATIGFVIQYTHSEINFDRKIPVYDYMDKASIDEISLIISGGVHF